MPTPVVHRLNGGKPLIERDRRHPWENKVTFNPACVLVDDRDELDGIIPRLPFDDGTKVLLLNHAALCFLFYRAQGKRTGAFDHTRSSIGLAVLSAELQLLARHSEPVLLPDQEYDNLGVEDPRITRVGSRYVMLYTAYASATPANRIRIALATTTDFVHWTKHGLLPGEFNSIDNKNAMLFPGRIGGKLVMLHRPMEGPHAMAIHWAEADDLFGAWMSRGVLLQPLPRPPFVDTWIGGGAPPLALPDGRFLVIYHIGNRKSDATREYDLGIAVADPRRPEFIVKRDEPLLRPETAAETKGDADLGVNNVVFICGAFFYGNDLFFPYAGADSVVLGGKIAADEIRKYLS